ncbi:MAG: hypothetical protein DDT34_02548 [Firmicutes bacterium]|nr:hypothetical protein [Bacillota bacterium]
MATYINEQEFIEDMKNFFDVEFVYRGKSYFICPLNGKFEAGEAYQDAFAFESIQALLDGFMLEGCPLKEVILELEILAR